MPATFNSYPFNNQQVYEPEWRNMAENWRTNGVIIQGGGMDSTGGECAVSPGTGLEIRIAPGKAWIKGHFFSHTDDYEYMPITPNTSGSTRTDLVVIRCILNSPESENRIQYHILEGTTTPERNETNWDLPLATVNIPDGASSIASGDITDLRVSSNQNAFIPACQLTYGTAQNVSASPNGTITLNWSIARFNNMLMFDPGQPDRITIREPGIYFVQAMIYWVRQSGSAINGQMEMSIYQNTGTPRQFVRDSRYISLSNGVQSASQVVSCNAGDFLYVNATNTTSHTDLRIDAAQPYSPYFSVVKLGTAAGL